MKRELLSPLALSIGTVLGVTVALGGVLLRRSAGVDPDDRVVAGHHGWHADH